MGVGWPLPAHIPKEAGAVTDLRHQMLEDVEIQLLPVRAEAVR